jgi:hypothetical protein
MAQNVRVVRKVFEAARRVFARAKNPAAVHCRRPLQAGKAQAEFLMHHRRV